MTDYQHDIPSPVATPTVLAHCLEITQALATQTGNTTGGKYGLSSKTWEQFGDTKYRSASYAPLTVQEATAKRVCGLALTAHSQLHSVPLRLWFPEVELNNITPTVSQKALVEKWLLAYINPIVSAGSSVGNVVDNVTDVVDKPLELAAATTEFVLKLTDPTTWVRVAKVVLGGGLMLVGVIALFGDDVNRSTKQLLTTAAKAKAVAS